MFSFLSQKIQNAIQGLKGQTKITDQNIKPTLKEIRRALVAADVHYNIAKTLVNNVREKALNTTVKIAASPGQLFTKIVYEELTTLMGGNKVDISTAGNPAIILLVGLQGVGKTTLAGKLAARLSNEGKEVLLTSCDIYRPAAQEQLEVISKEIEVDIYLNKTSRDPLAIAKEAIAYATKHQKKVIIVDTAGRQAVDEKMMDEIAMLKKALNPSEVLFVVDVMMGQSAVETAKAFQESVNFDGIILTKMDGDTRGGAALAISYTTQKPVKLISTGEKMPDLDAFYPDRMAKRILGQGDVLSLVERAQQVFDEKEAQKLSRKLQKNELNFNDLIKQLRQIKKMGTLESLLSGLPGMGKNIAKQAAARKEIFKQFEVMFNSMTPRERANPDILDKRRSERIAQGSGLGEQKVKELRKQFEAMRRFSKKGTYKKYLNQLSKQR